ncbi:MAG: hypothetical protein OXG49_07205 [Chloroflexi bacterium]|nr:hypothetical protein [Chloroflexota bacterium]
MPDNGSKRRGPQIAVTITIALLIIVTSVFVAAFVVTSTPESTGSPVIDARSYTTDVAAALVGASASEGETLIEAFQCIACHVLGEGRIAPLFNGIADRASTRRPPLSAAQYLYESIVSPGAYLVV